MPTRTRITAAAIGGRHRMGPRRDRPRRTGAARVALRVTFALVLLGFGLPLSGIHDPVRAAPAGPAAYVVNMIDATVTRVDLVDQRVRESRIRTATHPTDLAITPDGTHAVVTDSCFNTVTMTTLTTGQAKRVPVGTVPTAVAITPDGGVAYIANFGSGTVTPVPLGSDWPGTEIPVGRRPTDIAITPSGATAYVTNSESDSVTPIDLATNTARPPIAVGSAPSAIAMSPDGSRAYVANAGSDSVTPIDLSVEPPAPGSTIAVGPDPRALAVGSDGERLFVATHGSNELVEISLATHAVVDRFPVGTGPSAVVLAVTAEPDDPIVQGGGSSVVEPASSEVGARQFEPPLRFGPLGQDTATASGSEPGTLDADGPGEPSPDPLTSLPSTAYVANVCTHDVSLIDPADPLAPPERIPVGTQPAGMAITPDGTKAYVASFGDGTVTPIDLATNTPGPIIRVGERPAGVAITPDGRKAFVVNVFSGTVTPIDVATDEPGDEIDIGRGSYPVWLGITPDGTKAYVVNYLWHSVVPIDVGTHTVGEHILVGHFPSGISFRPDGSRGYVSNLGDGTVTPIDIATDTPGVPIFLSGGPVFIAVSPDGDRAYVPLSGDTKTDVVDLTTTPEQLKTTIPGFGWPQPVGISPDGATVLVGNYGLDSRNALNTILPIRTATDELYPDSTIYGGFGPQAIAFIPDQGPTAAFEVVPAGVGEPVLFDASESTTPRGTIARYEWNFGDGTSAVTTAPTTTHVYDREAVFRATLRVVNSAGTSDSQVFTGQTVSRNGGPQARTARSVPVGDFTVPGAPGDLVATAGTGEVALDWDPPLDDGGTPIKHYRLYRGTDSGVLSLVAEVRDATTHTDETAVGGQTYVYAVSAVNAVGEGPRSSEVTASVPVSPPDPPADVTATRSNDVAALAWSPPPDNGSEITAYRIYRGVEPGSAEFLAEIGPEPGFEDETVPAGTAYYQVSAVNAEGEGARSIETTAPGPDSPTIEQPAAGAVERQWVEFTGVAPPGSAVEVWRGSTRLARGDAAGSGRWSAWVEAPLADGSHTVTARAVDPDGNTSPDSVPRTFDVDAVGPTVTIERPESSDEMFLAARGETVFVDGTAEDNHPTGVRDVLLEYRPITWSLSTGTAVFRWAGCVGCGTNGPAYWFHEPSLSPGYYEVVVHAFDKAGNASSPARRTFFVG